MSIILAAMLLNPFALVALALVVFGAITVVAERQVGLVRLTAMRLVRGFLCLIATALLIAVVSSYVSPEEALKLGVGPENYGSALRNEIVASATLIIYAAVIGCAFIGLPLTLGLAARNLATVPFLVLGSLAISLLFTLALILLGGIDQRSAAEAAFEMVLTHGALALSFAVGLGLPWRSARAVNHVA